MEIQTNLLWQQQNKMKNQYLNKIFHKQIKEKILYLNKQKKFKKETVLSCVNLRI